MTATATRPTERRPEQQPLVDEPKGTPTWLKVRYAVPAVLVIWLVAARLLRGKQTLAIGREDVTGFHTWLNDLNDKVTVNRDSNWVLHYVFGGISNVLDSVVTFMQGLISTPSGGRPVPEIGWLGVLALFVAVTFVIAGTRLAIFVGVCTLAFGYFGYWGESLDTLIITIVAVVLCVLIGIPTGIWMSRSKRATAVITPVLDVMQTMPSFAYLAPLALLFSIGAPAAVVTTFIYSVPPLIRITAQGLREVSPTTVEAAESMGVSRGQILRKVRLPMARRTIVVGLNQCTLAALSMATICALISGPGLGPVVVQALESLDIGTAAVAGGLIVLIAIALDRTTTAASERGERVRRAGAQDQRRRRIVLVAITVVTLVLVYLSHIRLALAEFPSKPALGPPTANWISDTVDTIVTSIDTFTLAVKNVVTYGLINPLQDLLANSPWWLTAAAILAIALLVGGIRAGISTVVCELIILGTGLWNDSMQTLTTTLVASVIVIFMAIGIGVWMGRSRNIDTVVRPVLDALQTIPPFVYLVPALALFGPTRFTAIFAAIAYGLPIACKLVANGIVGVSRTTVEAAESCGTTKRQMITKVQLPMATSAVVLAGNQGLLYVLSMVVIGGLVGGGGLGYLVVAGFSQSELFGKGLAAGIAITALGVMLDRIAHSAAARHGRA
ncbi:MAG: glycine betaine/proline transport system permease protein [Nocardioidaceae bacterium]|jgi:glycine betaine/proline transport system permease protein|nr:glycine betaine/proline transport system permease protein [Nocardioidaceae bacterium]